MLNPVTHTKKALLVAGSISLLGLSTLVGQTPDEDYWSDQDFVERFTYSYTPNLAIEPRLDSSQKEFLEELAVEMSKDRQKAIGMLESKLRSEFASPAFSVILGNIYYQDGNLQKAAEAYEAAIKKQESFRRAYENLGFLYFQMGKTDKARDIFTKAIKLGSEDKNIYAILGYLFYENGQFIASETSYRNALVYEANNQDWAYGLAKAVLLQGKLKDAIGLFDNLIKSSPEEAEYWELQADAYLGLKQNLKAASNYEVLRRLGHIKADNLITLGDIYVENGFIEPALQVYKEALRRKGTLSIEKPIAAANTLVAAGYFDEAEEVVKIITENFAQSLDSKMKFEVQKLQAQILAAKGSSNSRVIALLEQMTAQNPLDGDILILLADYYAPNNFEKAEFLYERAEEISSYEAKAYFHHGKALVDAGKYREALSKIQHSMDIYPVDNVEAYLIGVRNLYRAVR